MLAGFGVLRLGGVDEAEEFVKFETFGRGREELFEDRGGFSVVAGFVLSHGLLELAIETGRRGRLR